MPLTREQLHAFARLGAEARLAQLDSEIAAIKAAYPDLATKRAMPRQAGAQAPAARAATPRKQYRMSPEARKAAAERMRKYWAARRGAKQEPAPVAVAQEAPRKSRSKAARPKARGRKKRG